MSNNYITWDELKHFFLVIFANMLMILVCFFIFLQEDTAKLTYFEGIGVGFVIVLAFLFLNSILYALGDFYE